MDIGSELRHARERRGLSLHDLSDRTKIGVSGLRAIENNEIERLPGGIFTRGFLKAYALEVGLDPTDLADRYISQFEPPAEDAATAAEREVLSDHYAEPGAATVSEYSGAISAIAAVVLVAACFFVLSRLQTVRSPEQAEVLPPATAPPAAAPASPATAPRSEIGTAGSTDRLRVELQPDAECWVSATADGTRVIYRTIQPGERQTIEAREAIVLRVGDAAGCGYAVNGTPGRSLGRPGEAITVTITPDNYQTFFRQ